MSVQTLEQRRADLVRLRRLADLEIARLDAAIAAQPRWRRRRGEIPPCGSEKRYQWHKRHGEIADADCLAAHAAYERGRARGAAS